MPQMAIAAPAADLGAHHSVARIAQAADVVGVKRFEKAGPAGTGFEFGARSEQWQAAQPAAVNTVLLVVEQAAAKGRLGAMIQQDSSFLGSQSLGQTLPFHTAELRQRIAGF